VVSNTDQSTTYAKSQSNKPLIALLKGFVLILLITLFEASMS